MLQTPQDLAPIVQQGVREDQGPPRQEVLGRSCPEEKERLQPIPTFMWSQRPHPKKRQRHLSKVERHERHAQYEKQDEEAMLQLLDEKWPCLQAEVRRPEEKGPEPSPRRVEQQYQEDEQRLSDKESRVRGQLQRPEDRHRREHGRSSDDHALSEEGRLHALSATRVTEDVQRL